MKLMSERKNEIKQLVKVGQDKQGGAADGNGLVA